MELKFFHGTSEQNAKSIQQNGFKISTGGCLGPGVYFARQDKAERFAQNYSNGAVVVVVITVNNPKYMNKNKRMEDDDWIKEGHDSCRVDCTNLSRNMEWVVKSPSQVRFVRYYTV